ncbi:MAG: hypothetical protein ACFCU4_08040 [Puniceicoccaceae bacterium]
MKNPIIEEKEAVQLELSQLAGSVEAYMRIAHQRSTEIEGELGIQFIRSSGSINSIAAEAQQIASGQRR